MKFKLSLLLLLVISQFSFAQKIERIEPANWWVDMTEPNVQIMLQGKNLENLTPSLKYKGVKLQKIHKAESPNYLFIDLFISPNAKPGFLKFDLGNGEVLTYELKSRNKGSKMRKGFGPEDAIYLITPDRFANGDKSNDNVSGYEDLLNPDQEYGRHGGDIQGMIDHLDYISKMGFTAIWPMPLEENKMPQWSYHGYAITDFYKIDPRFGSNETYATLSKECKKYDIKLIKDVVLNHCGLSHWWMNDKPFSDWINNQGQFVNTSHRREVLRDIHASEYDKKRYSDGWFVPTMPDLNQRNPFMANYLIQNSLWWIETYDLDGFRVDTYPYSDKDFLQNWSSRILKEYPNFNITSEEWSMNPAINAYWQKGKTNRDGYVSYVPTPMDFPLQAALVKGLKTKEGWNEGLIDIYFSVANDFQYANESNLLIFPDNHDMSRIYTQLGEDIDHFKMAITLMATMRGIPQLYYGTEILMANPKSDSHGEIRGDFPGGNWPNIHSNAFTGEGLTASQKDAQDFVRQLLNYRKSSKAITEGKLLQFVPEDGFYVYFRLSPSEKLMVILNKNELAKNLDLSRFREVLPSGIMVKNILTGENIKLQDQLSIPAKSAMILEFR